MHKNMRKVFTIFPILLFLRQAFTSLNTVLLDPSGREKVENNFGQQLKENFNSLNPGMISKFIDNGFEFYETDGGYYFETNSMNQWKGIQRSFKKVIKMKLLNKSIIYYALQSDQANGKFDQMNCVYLKSDMYEEVKGSINHSLFSIYPQAYKYTISVPHSNCRLHWKTLCQRYQNEQRTGYHQILCYNHHSNVGTQMWDLLNSHFLKKFGYKPQDFTKACPDYGFDLNSFCIPNCDICSTHLKCSVCIDQYALQQKYCVSCHDYCDKCTEAQNPKKCVNCSFMAFLFEGECVSECPESYYSQNRVCLKCDKGCETCKSSSDYCYSCRLGYYLQGNSCVNSCKKGTYADEETRKCLKCHDACTECTGPNNNQCQACSVQFCLNQGNLCIQQCNPVEGKTRVCNYDTRICEPCHMSCKDCNAVGQNMCTECYKPLFRQTPQSINTSCDDKCFDGKASDSNNDCQSCLSPCATCKDLTISNCITCLSGYFLHLKQVCLKQCPVGFVESGQECVKCQSNCKKCQLADKPQCLECEQGSVYLPDDGICVPFFEGFKCKPNQFLLNKNSCVSRCPEGLYADQLTQECQKQCSNGYNIFENWICVVCIEKMMKIQNQICVQECNSDNYYDKSKAECFKCHESCLTCSGRNSNECLSCKSPLLFSNSKECKQKCDEGEYFEKEQNQCQSNFFHFFIKFNINPIYIKECDFSCSVCDSNKKECIYCKKSYKYYFEKSNGRVECLMDCSQKGEGVVKYNNYTFKQCLSNIIDQNGNNNSNNNNGSGNNTTITITGLFIDQDSDSCLLKRGKDSTCQKCQQNYYQQSSQCLKCSFNCLTCSGPNLNQCKSCYQGFINKDGLCKSQILNPQIASKEYDFQTPYKYLMGNDEYKNLEMPPLDMAKKDDIQYKGAIKEDINLKTSTISSNECLLVCKSIIMSHQGLKLNGNIVNPNKLHSEIFKNPECFKLNLDETNQIYSTILNSCKMTFDDGVYIEQRKTIQVNQFQEYIKQSHQRLQNGEQLFYLIKISGIVQNKERNFNSHFLIFKKFITPDIIEVYDVGYKDYFISKISLKNLSVSQHQKLKKEGTLFNNYKKLSILEIRETYFKKELLPQDSIQKKFNLSKENFYSKQPFQNIKQKLSKIYQETQKSKELYKSCDLNVNSLKIKDLVEERKILLADLCFLSNTQLIQDTQYMTILQQHLNNNQINQFNSKIIQSSYFLSSSPNRKKMLLKLLNYNNN